MATRTDYLERLSKLEEVLTPNEDSEVEEKPDYVIESVYHIYKVLIEKDQFFDAEITEPIVTEKLIRCHRYVPQWLIDSEKVERIAIGGLYLVAKVYLFPTSLLEEVEKKDRLFVNPESFGLLSHDEVNWGTRKRINETYSVAIMKGSWTDGIIDYASQYDYVTLN